MPAGHLCMELCLHKYYAGIGSNNNKAANDPCTPIFPGDVHVHVGVHRLYMKDHTKSTPQDLHRTNLHMGSQRAT